MKLNLTPRNIPENSTPVTREGLDAVAYYYTNTKGRPCAIGYAGKSNKPSFWHYYFSEEQREVSVTRWFDGLQTVQKMKEDEKKRKAEFQHNIQVGDIFNNSWGYDQTNVDFYQVVRVLPKKVVVRELQQTSVPSEGYGSMAGRVMPIQNEFCSGEQMMTVVPDSTNNPALRVKHGWCGRWNGKPQYSSWGH